MNDVTNTIASSERRERQKVELRAKILDATRQLIVQGGVDNFSMRKLAANIGYTAPSIYSHFKDKDALLQELVDEDFRRFQANFDPQRTIPDPVERIAAMGRSFVDFMVRNPDHFRFMFMTPSVKIVPKVEEGIRGNPAFDSYCLLKQSVLEALEQKRFRDEFTDPETLCQMFCGTVNGIVSLFITRHSHPWIDFRDVHETADQAIHAILRGTLKPESQVSQ